MGLFKQLKDANKAVKAAPGLVDQAMQMKGQAEQMQAAQAAAAQAAQPAPAAMATGPDVSLAAYAEVCREAQGGDEAQLRALASARGISPEAFDQAMAEFGARMQRNPAVAGEFNRVYTGG
jgi:hypothetical protein